MPSIINASSTGSGGIVQTADASGVLQLQSNGTVALTISGANVSFGSSSSPSGWSQYQAIELINGGSNGALAKWGSGLNTAIVNNAYYSSAWTYYSTNTVALYQQETGATHNFYSAPSGTAGTGVSLTQLMTFAKDTSIALQGASRQTGTGITFPATQNASTNANTLDDYEEGTWTPTTSQGVGLSVSTAYYRKIGNLVYISTFINVNSNSNPNDLLIVSLPFALDSGSSSAGCFNNNTEDLYAYQDGSGIYIRGSNNTSKTLTQLSGKFVAFELFYPTAS
jgi:hypothetical protein